MKTIIVAITLLLSYAGISQTYYVQVLQSPYLALEDGDSLVQETWNDPVFSASIGFNFPFFAENIHTLYSQDFFSG